MEDGSTPIAPATRQPPRVDLTGNSRQLELMQAVLRELHPATAQGYRNFFYGGGIRGGKTYVSLTIFSLLAKKYPGSRWHVIRESMPLLKATTIPSMEKILDGTPVKWHRGADYHVRFPNASRIHFISENYQRDKDLNRFKGLETNGILLEQLEEIQYATWQKALERVGSWYTTPMPPSFIFATFNPTQGWLRSEIYDKWKRGELAKPYYYLTALPTDNPYVTADQWAGWDTMDDLGRARFVEGNWDAFDASGLFAYSFKPATHIAPAPLALDKGLPLWLSFDFNVSPMTALLCQHDGRRIRILREFRQSDTGIYEFMRDVIVPQLPPGTVYVTGDPAGRARSALAARNLNYYIAITEVLGLGANSVRLLPLPPTHENSQVLCNAILSKFPSLLIDPGCKGLIHDLQTVKMRADGTIDKDQAIVLKGGKTETIGHLLDCLRYYLHLNFPNFVRI